MGETETVILMEEKKIKQEKGGRTQVRQKIERETKKKKRSKHTPPVDEQFCSYPVDMVIQHQ